VKIHQRQRRHQQEHLHPADVLLHRSRSLTALLLKLHGTYDGMNEALIRQVKRAKKWHAQRKQAAAKTAPKAAPKADKAPSAC